MIPLISLIHPLPSSPLGSGRQRGGEVGPRLPRGVRCSISYPNSVDQIGKDLEMPSRKLSALEVSRKMERGDGISDISAYQ